MRIFVLLFILFSSTPAISAPNVVNKSSDFCMANVCIGDDYSKFPEALWRIRLAEKDMKRDCVPRKTTYQMKGEFDSDPSIRGVDLLRDNERIYLSFNPYIRENGKLSFRVEKIHYLSGTPASESIIENYLNKYTNLNEVVISDSNGKQRKLLAWSSGKETVYVYNNPPGPFGGPNKLSVNYILDKSEQIELDTKIQNMQNNCKKNKQL